MGSATLNSARDTYHESEFACVDLRATAGVAEGPKTFMTSLKNSHQSMPAERKGCITTRALKMMFQLLRVLQVERTVGARRL